MTDITGTRPSTYLQGTEKAPVQQDPEDLVVTWVPSGFLLWEHQEIVQRRGKGPDTFQRASHRGQGPGKVPLSVGEEAGMDSQPSELGVSTGEGPLEMPGKT